MIKWYLYKNWEKVNENKQKISAFLLIAIIFVLGPFPFSCSLLFSFDFFLLLLFSLFFSPLPFRKNFYPVFKPFQIRESFNFKHKMIFSKILIFCVRNLHLRIVNLNSRSIFRCSLFIWIFFLFVLLDVRIEFLIY